MAEEDVKENEDGGDGAEGEEGEEGEGGKKKGKKKLILILVPVLLLVIGAGVFFMMGGKKEAPVDGEHVEGEEHAGEHAKKDGKDGEHAEGDGTGEESAEFAYYELPAFLVNIAGSNGRTNFLKISVSLEVESESEVEEMKKYEPRIVDKMQIYLRGLRLDDLQGSQSVYRLREELLQRVNATVAPKKVSQVLFKEILVQ